MHAATNATAEVGRPTAALGGHVADDHDSTSNHHAAGSAEPFAKPDHKAKRHGKPRKSSYFKPRKPRLNEVVGGGFFVFRRFDDTGRIHPKNWPYEHGSLEAAQAEAARLAAENGGSYEVFGAVAGAVDGPATGGDDYAVGDVVAVGLEAHD